MARFQKSGNKGTVSRKDRRKKERKEKKYKKMLYFSKKFGHSSKDFQECKVPPKGPKKPRREKQKTQKNKEFTYAEVRKLQLKEANADEDKSIKRLEKMLKLNRRKSKNIPRSFCADGLDYILELIHKPQDSQLAEFDMNAGDEEISDDLSTILGKNDNADDVQPSNSDQEVSDSDPDEGHGEGFFVASDQSFHKKPEKKLTSRSETLRSDTSEDLLSGTGGIEGRSDSEGNNSDCSLSDRSDHRKAQTGRSEKMKGKLSKNLRKDRNCFVLETNPTKKSGPILKNSQSAQDKDSYDQKTNNNKKKEGKSVRFVDMQDSAESDGSFSGDSVDNLESEDDSDSKMGSSAQVGEGCWEDIYGRMRDEEGNIIHNKNSSVSVGKYVPPAKRAMLASNDAKKQETLMRLHKQMRGLFNKLNESNMHHISGQVENLYMQHSRNDMNEALVHLIQHSVVLPYLTPEKLIMEHALLITVLHCNVGSEVGAHCLQTLTTALDTKLKEHSPEDDRKEIDNLLMLLCHLYTFKVTHNHLIYDILRRLTERFTDKDIELILLILRSIGFALRKDDPLELKNLILSLQSKASSVSTLVDTSRVRFMLDTMMAIRNNNMQKIPNYDPSLAEHLRKFMKTLLHKGKYVQELNISLEDLLKANEQGRWWIVGSAWQGKSTADETEGDMKRPVLSQQFSEEVLELARKQHMNTEVRKNIFCVLMSAEDYMDAFEKLLHLGLKNQQDREFVHIALHCCLQEKVFNPYYSHLMEKFCTFDRKYQLVLQFALWDKFKEMGKLKPFQVTNLAKCLVHLFTRNALPLSVLKVIQLSELDKTLVKFLRQVLLAILLHESEDVCHNVFLRIAPAKKLHSMREGLRLFMLHFLLRNQNKLSDSVARQLKERVDLAVKSMNSVESA